MYTWALSQSRQVEVVQDPETGLFVDLLPGEVTTTLDLEVTSGEKVSVSAEDFEGTLIALGV